MKTPYQEIVLVYNSLFTQWMHQCMYVLDYCELLCGLACYRTFGSWNHSNLNYPSIAVPHMMV